MGRWEQYTAQKRYGDVVLYCEDCVAYTGHERRTDGTERCLLCDGGTA